jgi:hypothetical protein
MSPVAFQYVPGGGNITNAIVTPVSVAETLYNALFNQKIKKGVDAVVENAYKFASELRPSLVANRLMEQFELCYNGYYPKKDYLKVMHVMP